MKRVFSFLLCSFLSSIALSQIDIQGIVLDENNEPMHGAAVRDLRGLKGVATEQDGSFRITNVRSGRIILEFSFLGYKTIVDTIESQDDIDGYQKQMQPDPFLADELIVSATRVTRDEPVSHVNLDREQIEEMNTGRDMPYIIAQTPSVVTTSDAGAGIGYTGLRIRGVDQTNINVTINGIALNDAESHGVYWVDVPDLASSLTDIQIQRGVGTSTNGSGAFGATINLQTENINEDPYGEINLGYGSFNTIKSNVRFGSGMLNNRWWVEGRLTKINSEGYIDRATTDLRSYFLTGGFNNGKTSIKAVLFGGHERTYQAWNGIDSAQLADNRKFNPAGAKYDDLGNIRGFYDNEVDNYDQDHYQIHLNQKISNSIRLNVALHYTYGRGYYENYRSGDALSTYGIDSILVGGVYLNTSDVVVRQWLSNHYYGSTFNLNYQRKGFTADFGGAANGYDGDHFGELVWARFSGDAEPDDEYYFNNGLKNDYNLYFKLSKRLGDFSVFADLQYRFVSYRVIGHDEYAGNVGLSDSLSFFNPKIGVNYSWNIKHRLFYSFAVGNREPNRNDYIGALPDKAKPERLYDNEFGYRYSFGSSWLQANLYYMYYIDQLVLTGGINNVGEALRSNIGESYRAGIELSGSLFITSRLLFRPNITFSSNKNLDFNYQGAGGSITEATTDIAFSPNIIGNTSLQYKPIDFIYLIWYSTYVGEQYLDNTQNERLKLQDYLVNDFRVEFRKGFGKISELSAFVMVNNILGAEYSSNGYVYSGQPFYFPQAGRNYMVGLKIRM